MKMAIVAAALSLALLPSLSHADESSFLNTLGGSWTGKGTIIRKIGSRAIPVTCTFNSTSRGPALSMSGQCRGLLVVRRAVSADIRAKGARYSGTYIGPSGRPSTLSGARKGDAIRFAVRWSREINGDRDALLTIEKVGARGLRLRTTDKDPATGRNVVTSDIRLTR